MADRDALVMAVDYLTVDYAMGQPAQALTDFYNSYGADGWLVSTIEIARFDRRRAVFMQVGAVTEYLVIDYDAGKAADTLTADLNGYGADGWELAQVDLARSNVRRAILTRGPASGGGGNGGGSPLFSEYTFSTGTNPPPSSGHLLLNTVDFSDTTGVYVNNITGGGTDITHVLERIAVGSTIIIQDKDDSSQYVEYSVTAVSIDGSTYWEIPVAFLKGAGDFQNNKTVGLVMQAGSGGGGGGIPEAPSDGKTYGRQDATWNWAIAHDNDVMDGGSF